MQNSTQTMIMGINQMENNQWGVYKVKSRVKGGKEKAPSLATAGKEAPKMKKAGQSMGRRIKKPLSPSEHDMQAASPLFLPVNFTVEGDVVPQGRPRFFRRGNMVGAYDPPKSKAWKKLVADTAITHGCKPLDGPLEVELTFYLKKPKAMKDDQLHAKRPDVDNLAKAVLDALTGICWHDDAQIGIMIVVKKYSDCSSTGVDIEVGEYLG